MEKKIITSSLLVLGCFSLFLKLYRILMWVTNLNTILIVSILKS